MSDRELIIHFLEKAEKRARFNKRFNDIAVTVAFALIIPIVFKLLDLYFLFRARTILIFLGAWIIATVAFLAVRLRGRSPLNQVAGSIDRKAQLNDQLKTAYWFIQNPRNSQWVDAQIHRAAGAAGKVRLDALFPLRFPRASLICAALVFVFGALNFLPLSLNSNWLKLQAAPPFRLSEEARKSLQNALRLLEKARNVENQKLAQQIQELIQDLEQGNISEEEATQALEDIQNELEAGELDTENLGNGIGQMAAILRQSKALQEAAAQMGKGALFDAASQIEQLDARLDSVSAGDLREMAEKLQLASERPRSGLENLATAFASTGAAIQRGDQAASHTGFNRITRELQTLAQQIADQALRSEAADELDELLAQLEGDSQTIEGQSTQGGRTGNQDRPAQPAAGQSGEAGEEQDAQALEGEEGGDPGENAEAGEGGQQGGEGGEAGDNPGGNSEDSAAGRGGNSFGGSTKSAPLEGEATTLEVQLQKEALKLEGEGNGGEPNQDLEAAGERERSRLDYRNAPSDLTPAQKDLLSQDRIPWESRQLIKNYFQAVKPVKTK